LFIAIPPPSSEYAIGELTTFGCESKMAGTSDARVFVMVSRIITTCGFLLLLCRPLTAGNCTFLGDPIALRDGQLFYQPPESSQWVEVGNASALPSGQTLKFAYVVSQTVSRTTGGAIVFKSGRRRTTDESDNAPDEVRLDRNVSEVTTKATCGVAAEFHGASVSARSYDQFHDQAGATPESDREALKKFHYVYYGRNGCTRRTDSLSKDSRIPADPRSSRSQFSFDPDIVAHGIPDRYVALVRPNAARAAPSQYAERRVQLHAYTLPPGLPTCVRFDMPVAAKRGFLRVNDLEALKKQDVYLLRADEAPEWTLSR
jgi:hypothetical protein